MSKANTEVNKLNKLRKHVKKFPNDKTAISLLADIEGSKKSFSVRKASVSKDGWVTSNINSVNNTNERKEELKKLFKPELRTNQLKEMARHLKLVKKFLNLDLYAQKNK